MSFVTHVIAPGPYGGAESVVRVLCAGSVATGRAVSAALLLPNGSQSSLAAAMRECGVPVDEIRCGRRAYRAEARELRRVLRARGTTVVHTHVYRADVVGWMATKRTQVRCVATLHGYTGGSLVNRAYQWLDHRLLGRFDAVVCVSEQLRQRLLRTGATGNRLHVVRNGFAGRASVSREEARRLLGLPLDRPAVGWVGRLSHEKGADLFVEAMMRCPRSDAIGVIVGDGPQRRDLQARVGPGAAIRLVGSRPDIGQLMPAFDVLAISSRAEGTPMVLLEAMSARVPIASFAVGGIPELLPADAAWFAAPGDTAGLAASIAAALDFPTEAERRADTCVRLLEAEFGVERWLRDLDRIYASLA
jgi:glycosyltransferase involved in cell wall biosynthesis